MVVNTYKCDVVGCDQVRKEANHWLLSWTENGRFILCEWDDDLAKEEGILHLCGGACALKALANYLARI